MHIIGVWAGSKGSVKNVWKFWNFFKNENFSEDKLSTQTLILLTRYLLYACRTPWNYVLLREMQFLRFLSLIIEIILMFHSLKKYFVDDENTTSAFCPFTFWYVWFINLFVLLETVNVKKYKISNLLREDDLIKHYKYHRVKPWIQKCWPVKNILNVEF